jgi:hypothetical protein
MTLKSQETDSSNMTSKIFSGKTIIAGLLIITLLGSVFGGVVMGQSNNDDAPSGDVGSDFLCPSNADNPQFVDSLSPIISLIVFGAPVAGTLVFGGYYAAAASPTGRADKGSGKSALIAGWSAPFVIYGLQFGVDIIFGIDMSCLTP